MNKKQRKEKERRINMFREMRRIKQQVSEEECKKVLNECKRGVLSLIGDDGYPYGVPISYVYVDGAIYCHSAGKGYKVDCIKRDPKVCFSSTVSEEIVEKETTAKFESFIAFGKASFVDDADEKRKVMTAFVDRLTPNEIATGMAYLEKALASVNLIKVTIEDVKGKAYLG